MLFKKTIKKIIEEFDLVYKTIYSGEEQVKKEIEFCKTKIKKMESIFSRLGHGSYDIDNDDNENKNAN